MATKAHCAFCFETLSAGFEKRQALKLAEVEELWEQFQGGSGQADEQHEGETEDDDAEMMEGEPAKPAAISRLLNHGGSGSSSSAASSSSSLPSTSTSSTASSAKSIGISNKATPASSSTSLTSPSQAKRKSFPLFITWNTHNSRGHKSLRGCIGTFEAQELEYGLRSYALTSAFEDTRFSPIPASLLPSLSVHVTLLTDFSQPTRDPLDWTLGKHGIRISFSSHGRRYGATYLPDVAQEQGWTKDETLISLMRKSGWNGSSSSWQRTWRDGRGELIRYEGRAIGLEYAEWREWRDFVDKQGGQAKALN